MSDTAFLINAFFKIINFAILIGISSYYFYTKFLAQLLKKMHEQHAIIPKLEEERRGFQNQEDNIETAIEQQALIAKVLQKKIEGWAASHQKHLQEQKEHSMQMQQLLMQKTHKQDEYRAKKAFFAYAIPGILTQTQEILAQKYQNADDAQKYMDNLFLHIKDEL